MKVDALEIFFINSFSASLVGEREKRQKKSQKEDWRQSQSPILFQRSVWYHGKTKLKPKLNHSDFETDKKRQDNDGRLFVS